MNLDESNLRVARASVSVLQVSLGILLAYRRGEIASLGADWSAEKKTAIQRAEKRRPNYLDLHVLPDVQRRLCVRVDRFSHDADVALLAAINLIEDRRIARERAERQAEHRRQRTERIERERRERAERERRQREFVAQPVATVERPEHEERPMCEKCGKRPQASGGLCRPCARWGGNR